METSAVRPWIRLDNAAKIFPSVTSSRLTHLFRLAVTLDQPIDPALLTEALHAVLPRFPSFRFRLSAGFFWYTLVKEESLPPVYPETPWPLMPFQQKFRHPLLLRVRWFDRRIAVEFNHALTDGRGGTVFLQALTAEYLHRKGIQGEDPQDLRRAQTPPDPAEADDMFQSLYDPDFPQLEPWRRAYQPPYPLLPRGNYHVTTGRLSAEQLRASAKAHSATVTEYLAATFLAALQEAFWAIPHASRRRAHPLRLVVPVDLRSIFPSPTLRNFFVVVPLEIDPRLGFYQFDEILRQVHHQLQAEMDPKLLQKTIIRNLRGELNPVARILPLPLKNLVLTSVYGSYERQHTASLSNLGKLTWPQPWAPHVKALDFTPPPSPFCRINAAVATCGDTLSVTFGNLSANPSVERAFFTHLRRAGLAVRIESNRSPREA